MRSLQGEVTAQRVRAKPAHGRPLGGAKRAQCEVCCHVTFGHPLGASKRARFPRAAYKRGRVFERRVRGPMSACAQAAAAVFCASIAIDYDNNTDNTVTAATEARVCDSTQM
jgi:hypothetical protein